MYLEKLAKDHAELDHCTTTQVLETWYNDITSSDYDRVWRLFHVYGPDSESPTEPFNSQLVEIMYTQSSIPNDLRLQGFAWGTSSTLLPQSGHSSCLVHRRIGGGVLGIARSW
jgi:hypothetical protein